jgi:hypothetical protein
LYLITEKNKTTAEWSDKMVKVVPEIVPGHKMRYMATEIRKSLAG